MNDERLIREYCLHGNEQAFAELVRRYSGLVYGTARRHLGDPFVAEEVSQKAFCALAGQLASIKKPSQLPAWLYQTTRRLAAMQIRTDSRRAARERMAATMDSNVPNANESWENVEPLLNEGLDNLAEPDRSAILLRFFRGMTMAEVGEALGVSEPAAKMRVGRAVEKLRRYFVQHGVTCSVAALAVLLGRNAAAEPPASLVGSVLNYVATKATTSQRLAVRGSVLSSRAGLFITVGAVLLGLIWIISISLVSPKTEILPAPKASLARSATEATPPTPAKLAELVVPKGQLQVTVLDEKTSQPILGARVTAGNLGRVLGEAGTDWAGHALVPLPAGSEGDFYYKLRVEYQGYATMVASWSRFQHDNPSDIPQTLEIRMPPGTRIGGRVTDEGSQPLASVKLRIQSYWSRGGPPPRTRPLLNDGSGETVITDQEGKWSFDRLPPQWENVRFKVNSRDFAPAELACDANDRPSVGRPLLAKADLLALHALIVLRRGPVLEGKVLDQNQQPIAGVRVVQNYNWADEFASTTTGRDGVYEILNAPTGAMALCFQAGRYSPRTISVTVDGSSSIPDTILSPGHLLWGNVMDEEGGSIEGAEVDMRSAASSPQEFQFRTTTDSTGSFSWDGAPSGLVSVEFYKSGFLSTNLSIAADGQGHSINLHHFDGAGVRVQGQVLDEATGQPVPSFKFFVYDGHGDETAPKEGAQGKFSAWLESLTGTASIEIHADGYASATSTPVCTTNGDQAVLIRLRLASGWSGLVLLPDGKPAAGAEVVLVSQLKGAILGRRKLLFRDQSVYRVTGSDGSFHFDQSKDAALIVAVHPRGYAEQGLDELSSRPVCLQAWGRIEGTLRSSGPVAHEKVCLLKRFWTPWVPAVDLHADPFITSTDDNGHFAFDDVPPGDLAIGHLFAGGLFETRTTVQVHPGETAAVELGGNGRTVSGTIHAPKLEDGFDFSHSDGELKRIQSHPVDLENVARRNNFPDDEACQKAAALDGAQRLAYWHSAEGLAAWREARSYAVWFDADGTLHADDVPAGSYVLNVTLHKLRQIPGTTHEQFQPFAFYKANVTVPQGSASEPSAPADLGRVDLHSRW